MRINAIKNVQLIRLLMEMFAKILLPQLLLILKFVILKDIFQKHLSLNIIKHLMKQQIISIYNYINKLI